MSHHTLCRSIRLRDCRPADRRVLIDGAAGLHDGNDNVPADAAWWHA
jgi:hypothetical protein